MWQQVSQHSNKHIISSVHIKPVSAGNCRIFWKFDQLLEGYKLLVGSPYHTFVHIKWCCRWNSITVICVRSSLVETLSQINRYTMITFELPDAAAITIYYSSSFNIYGLNFLARFCWPTSTLYVLDTILLVFYIIR